MDFGNTSQNIAAVLAMLIAVALALSTALGPLVTYLTEAIKATGRVKDGYSGLVAIAVGMVLGMSLTALTDLMAAEPYSMGVMILLGAFVGAIVGAGGISQYKASGTVNTSVAYSEGLAHAQSERTDLATMDDLGRVMSEVERLAEPALEAHQFVKDVKAQAAQEAQRLMQAQVDTDPQYHPQASRG